MFLMMPGPGDKAAIRSMGHTESSEDGRGRWVVHGERVIYDSYGWVPLAEARGLISKGRVQSSGTLIALLHILAS